MVLYLINVPQCYWFTSLISFLTCSLLQIPAENTITNSATGTIPIQIHRISKTEPFDFFYSLLNNSGDVFTCEFTLNSTHVPCILFLYPKSLAHPRVFFWRNKPAHPKLFIRKTTSPFQHPQQTFACYQSALLHTETTLFAFEL